MARRSFGFLEVVDEDVSCFDPFLADRIDGRVALKVSHEGLRGRISAQSREMVAPRVCEVGDVAMLTFRIRPQGCDGSETLWNAGEVWQRRGTGRRIFHTHWSFATRGAEGAAG